MEKTWEEEEIFEKKSDNLNLRGWGDIRIWGLGNAASLYSFVATTLTCPDQNAYAPWSRQICIGHNTYVLRDQTIFVCRARGMVRGEVPSPVPYVQNASFLFRWWIVLHLHLFILTAELVFQGRWCKERGTETCPSFEIANLKLQWSLLFPVFSC